MIRDPSLEAEDRLQGVNKEDYVKALDALLKLPLKIREFLREIPPPLSNTSVLNLVKRGFIQKIYHVFRLTPAGHTALARVHVVGENDIFKNDEIGFLRYLTHLPPIAQLRTLEQVSILLLQNGQYTLTTVGLIAREEVIKSDNYITRRHPNVF